MKRNNKGKVDLSTILVMILIVVVVAVVCLFLGKKIWGGNGNGTGKGSETSSTVENAIVLSTDLSDEPSQTSIPAATSIPEILRVSIEEKAIYLDFQPMRNVQELIEKIQEHRENGKEIQVILNTETAVTNTAEDVKNALDLNDIPWTAPTPIPASE